MQRDVAGTPSRVDGRDRDHLADRAYVLQADVPLGELLIEVTRPLFEPCVAPVGLADNRRKRGFPLERGIDVLREPVRVVISRVPAPDERTDQLYAILRHRLPPFLPNAFTYGTATNPPLRAAVWGKCSCGVRQS